MPSKIKGKLEEIKTHAQLLNDARAILRENPVAREMLNFLANDCRSFLLTSPRQGFEVAVERSLEKFVLLANDLKTLLETNNRIFEEEIVRQALKRAEVMDSKASSDKKVSSRIFDDYDDDDFDFS